MISSDTTSPATTRNCDFMGIPGLRLAAAIITAGLSPWEINISRRLPSPPPSNAIKRHHLHKYMTSYMCIDRIVWKYEQWNAMTQKYERLWGETRMSTCRNRARCQWREIPASARRIKWKWHSCIFIWLSVMHIAHYPGFLIIIRKMKCAGRERQSTIEIYHFGVAREAEIAESTSLRRRAGR